MIEHIEQQKRDTVWKGVNYRTPEFGHERATAIQIEAWGLSGEELAPFFFTPDEIRLGLEFRARGKETGEDKVYAEAKAEETKEETK
jgi:hypothetical protein